MTEAAGARDSDTCGEGVPLNTVGERTPFVVAATILDDEPRTTVTSATAACGGAAITIKASTNTVATMRIDNI